MAHRLLIVVCCVCLAGAGGCGDTSEPRKSAGDRALSDPWNYGPSLKKPDTQPSRDDSSFDREGLKRDVNNVFNP